MKKRDRVAVAAMLAFGYAVTSVAQEQTIENAQKFLSMVLPGNEYTPGGMRDASDIVALETPSLIWEFNGRAKLGDAGAVSRCTSRLNYDVTPIRLIVWEKGNRRNTETEVPLSRVFTGDLKRQGKQEGFSWGEIKEVKASSGDVLLLFPGNRNSSRIHLGAEDLATRVAYAIQFLRTQCDPTSSTGF